MSKSGSSNPPKSFVRGPLMNDPIFTDLFNYWETLRAGRLAPLRSEIDPREIKSALEHTFIVETSNAGHPRIRLSGSQVCDLLGMELRGMPLRTLMEPEQRESFDEVLDQAMQTPEVIELSLSGQIAGDQRISARMLLLPLADRNEKLKRVMGCISLARALPRPPIRFEIEDILRTRIVAGAASADYAGFAGMAEDTVQFDHANRPKLQSIQGSGRRTADKPRNGHLKLVKDE